MNMPSLPPQSFADRRGLRLPAGSWDTHLHAIGDAIAFPLSPQHAYVPAAAALTDYVDMMDGVGCTRGVLIQPSIYGTDNRAMFAALAAYPGRFKAIAVATPEIDDRTLEHMHQIGVRGLRANLTNSGGISLAAAEQLAQRVRALGWHIQLQMPLAEIGQARSLMSIIPVVLDHFGFIDVDSPDSHTQRSRLLRLLGEGRCWVKMSAPYRLRQGSTQLLQALAAHMLAENPERLLWGSDWPHTDLRSNMPDEDEILQTVFDWVPDAAQRRQVLCLNPAQLYDTP